MAPDEATETPSTPDDTEAAAAPEVEVNIDNGDTQSDTGGDTGTESGSGE